MSQDGIQADVLIAGAGLAGLVLADELLTQGRRVVLFDKAEEARLGGLAKESFGGVQLIGTPHQTRLGIKDTPEIAYRDWAATAQFGAEDHWPREWAKLYCERSIPMIYDYLTAAGVEFLPVVNWPERGVHVPLNSLPRWHIAWGTGHEIIARMIEKLARHPRRERLEYRFQHEVNGLESESGRVVGLRGKDLASGRDFSARAEVVVIASGGMCGGDLSKVRANWYKPWGAPPRKILNGAHDFGDGMLHDRARELGAKITHLDKQWHYPAGVHHPAKRRPDDGLSLVPPRSALWFDAQGKRFGPMPLVGYTDSREIVERICKAPGQYSWQILNRKIALKELAVSGCDFMTAFRHKRKSLLLKHLLFGNHELVDRLIRECPDDFVVARSIPELVDGMNQRSLYGFRVDRDSVERAVREYDAQIDRGPAFFNDEQLRRLMNFRTYRGDRLRLCKYQKIDDPKARPLIAIREFILARKSLGGIQTDLAGRVLSESGSAIPGLFAIGEASGFGGGGSHGIGAMEGTFLGGCVLTARATAQTLATGG
jgi:predicted oxidoreductase